MNTDAPDGDNPLVPATDPPDPRHRPVVFYVPPRRVRPHRRAPGLAATTGSCLLIVPMLVIALTNPSTSSSIAGTMLQPELVVPATGSEHPLTTGGAGTAVPLPHRPVTTAAPSAGHRPSDTVGTRLVAAAELSVVGPAESAAATTRKPAAVATRAKAATATATATVTPAKVTATATPATPTPPTAVPAEVPSPAPGTACPSSTDGVIEGASGDIEGPIASSEGTAESFSGRDDTTLPAPTEASRPNRERDGP
jgi:hypothetical protein